MSRNGPSLSFGWDDYDILLYEYLQSKNYKGIAGIWERVGRVRLFLEDYKAILV